MILAAIKTEDGASRLAIQTPDGYIGTGFTSMTQMLQDPLIHSNLLELQQREVPQRYENLRLAAPTTDPSKMLFCGVNYEDHLEEVPQIPRPDAPFFFAKLPSTIIGPADDVIVPAPDLGMDYEAELAVIIGRRMKNVSRSEALQGVFGYTAVNDITARTVQFTDQQITLGKGMDTFCPMGPVVVTADSYDPDDVNVSCWVNDEERQRSNTKLLIAPVAELLSYLSRTVTLMPGDVIATGTPAGVGHFMEPPMHLQPGDRVRVEVEGIGEINNQIVQGWNTQ